MKLLVISPDYASHVEPMLQIALDWQQRMGPCVVASGDTVRPSVEKQGLAWRRLQLGRGSNGGTIRADEQPPGEDDHLRAFFDATRAGPIATLLYQAEARRHDLLFEPERVLSDITALLAEIRPDRVLVDQIAFGARLALHALGVEAATLVLGHPSALPAPGEWYGCPPCWPADLRPVPEHLVQVERVCARSTVELTDTANAVIAQHAPHRPTLRDLTSVPGDPTIYMYPSRLHDPGRPLPPGSVSVGSLRRAEEAEPDELPRGDGPLVVVTFGTFLSARDDVLRTAMQAALLGGWRLALASGSTPQDELGPAPPGALVREYLPLVALLEHADVLVTHGGNNSVTEACAAGVPMVVLPMSTDQFANAAAIERAGVGLVLDANHADAAALAAAVADLLSGPATARIAVLAESVRDDGGAGAAVDAISASR